MTESAEQAAAPVEDSKQAEQVVEESKQIVEPPRSDDEEEKKGPEEIVGRGGAALVHVKDNKFLVFAGANRKDQFEDFWIVECTNEEQ